MTTTLCGEQQRSFPVSSQGEFKQKSEALFTVWGFTHTSEGSDLEVVADIHLSLQTTRKEREKERNSSTATVPNQKPNKLLKAEIRGAFELKLAGKR